MELNLLGGTGSNVTGTASTPTTNGYGFESDGNAHPRKGEEAPDLELTALF
jgi:hypothetical protein